MKIELHRGVELGLRRLSMTEMDVAEAIRDGELASPQPFENMVLVDMRISGTGVSYRPKLKEWVYRRPEIYLTPEFLKRCQGIPVIYEHPERSVLDTNTFSQQIVGVMQLPYIKGEDVWGVARIYNVETAMELASIDLSTSPSVVFRDPKVNYEVQLDNGETLLVEGNPSYLDHLAVCEKGVWDKGGEPTGIRVDSEPDPRLLVLADGVSNLDRRLTRHLIAQAVGRLERRITRMEARYG